MREIRRVSGFQSRSKNAKARSSIPVTLVRNGVESTEHVATEELPLMLGLPWFSLPGKLDDCDEGNLRLAGWVALSFGPALDTFLRARGATEMVFQEGKQQPVAFARMIAKIAYCHAWRDGVPELLEGTERLIEAFMEKPDELGQFVGTQDPPFRQFPELKLRMQYHFEPVSSLVHMEVQLFPDAATPTYLVVLGRCRTHRCWRRVRERLGNTALNNRRDRYKLAASEALARSGQTSSYLQSNIHELQQALPPATNADLAMQKRILQGE